MSCLRTSWIEFVSAIVVARIKETADLAFDNEDIKVVFFEQPACCLSIFVQNLEIIALVRASDRYMRAHARFQRRNSMIREKRAHDANVGKIGRVSNANDGHMGRLQASGFRLQASGFRLKDTKAACYSARLSPGQNEKTGLRPASYNILRQLVATFLQPCPFILLSAFRIRGADHTCYLSGFVQALSPVLPALPGI